MKLNISNSTILYKEVLRSVPIQLCLLLFLSILLLFSGLSIRSLWGSEGRWSEVAREMILSGNYFLPTINGKIYFDKPLLSYWAILPCSLKGIVSETSSRIPSVISAIGVVFITFAVSQHLFRARAAIISAILLLTSFMFVLWSRTASAEIMNLFMIWLAFFVFLQGDCKRCSKNIIILYIIGAISSFCKGPVGPAVIFTSIGFFSTVELFITLRREGFSLNNFRESFSSEFCWIFSRQGVFGVFACSIFFVSLLLAPVIITGSWQSVQLMWKENVLRFFTPFDHIEPPYIYLKYIPLFFAPWTLFLVASLFDTKNWELGRNKRWIIFTTLSIFMFFTISGSRRSYYILPILPALAIITGKAIDDWIHGNNSFEKRTIFAGALLTSMILILLGAGLLYAYFYIEIPRHVSQLALGAVTMITATAAIRFFFQKKPDKGLIVLFALIFVLELWSFTVGMAVAESKRTLKPFAQKVSAYLNNVKDDKIVLYQIGDSALIFYLNRNPLKNINDHEQLKTFINNNPDGFIISNLKTIQTSQDDKYLHKMSLIFLEKPVLKKTDDTLCLFMFSGK